LQGWPRIAHLPTPAAVSGLNRKEAPLIETYYVAALAAMFGAAVGAAAVAGRNTTGTPKAYVVTEVDITGEVTTFQRDYAVHAQATIEPFGGRYLVRGGRTVGVEGEPPKPRIVISVFDSFERAQAWRNSPAYVKIAAVRERETKSRQYIVEGLPE
jgi:uncharacterized protein (DUF1330 family)